MKCIRCGAELAPEDRFCGECGTPRPQLPPRFAEAERRFAALRARYQAGELDDATYDAELRKLVIEDGSGGYWMLGAESGEWYWYDGAHWVRRDPPLAAAPAERPRVRPIPPPAVAPSPPAAPPARRGFPWKWVGVGCGGLLVIAVILVGVLAFPTLMRLIFTPQEQAGVTPVTSTTIPTATPPPEATPTVPAIQPTRTPTLPPTQTPTPTSAPAFSIRPYDPERDAGAESVISRVPDWGGTERPGNYQWEVAFPADTPALISMGWCAADERTLEANWSDMGYELMIDGFSIDLTQLAERDRVNEESVCRFYSGVLTGWSPGRHSYIWVHHIYETVSDGWDTFQAGDYVMEFIVDVVEGLVFEDDFSGTSDGWPEGEHENYSRWIEEGEYHILVKNAQRATWSPHRENRYSDFVFTAAARQVSDLPGEYGLIFRYQDDDHFYYFGISDDGYYEIGKRLEGAWVTIVDWTFSPAINQGQAENILGALCVGDEISVYVNDQALVTVSDDSLAEGHIGLMAITFDEPGVHVAFDWVVVEAFE